MPSRQLPFVSYPARLSLTQPKLKACRGEFIRDFERARLYSLVKNT